CPLCSSGVESQIPDFLGGMVTLNCKKCDVELLASRAGSGVNLRIPKGNSRQVPSRIVELVRERLPKRPWPTHIHKSIAADLNLSNGVVSRAIGRLIEQGFFPLDDANSTEQAEPSDARESPS
ncbi:MAG: hypothetical protein R3C53_27695, partial [Pirellulaceae bacterium]